jgi:hypothetical protein
VEKILSKPIEAQASTVLLWYVSTEEEDSHMELEAENLPGSEVLQELEAQHRRYSEQLEALIQKPYLSEEEQLEEVRLKKLKLHLKDKMAARRNGHPQKLAV